VTTDTAKGDRVVMVTGATSGIGLALVKACASAGDRVVLCARTAGAVDELARSLGGPARALAAPADVRRRAEVERAVALALGAFGRIDVLVNAAGVAGAAASESLDEAEWDRIVDTNLKGTFLACQVVGRAMLDAGRGAIVNVASIVAIDAFPRRAAYGSSKAAVVMLTKVLAAEWAGRGLRVNAVAPGVVRTEMNERMIAQGNLDLAAIQRRTPMGRRGEPAEVADAILFLASDRAAFTTGACLVVDGGWTSYGFL